MMIKTADSVIARDVDLPGAEQVKIRLLIHEADGAGNFYMRQFDVAPGGCTPKHAHPHEHEVYVLDGRGEVLHEGEFRPIEAGQCIFVAPEEEHQFRNHGDQTLRFLCLVPAE